MRTVAFTEKEESSPSWRLRLVALLAAVFVCVAAGMALPAHAQAKSYSMPQVTIDATVTDAGDLQVQERRTFDFDGDFSAVWWSFDDLPQGASIQVNGVRIADGGQDEALSWTKLPRVSFQLGWRTEGGPSSSAYSVDDPMDTVYVFFDKSDTTVTVELDYVVLDAVQAYADVGELYWQFVGDGWQEASDNVSATITLPVPKGQTVQAGDTVRAWGHGPLDATVAINDDGTVTYAVPSVAGGSYAEARIVFPADWLTGVASGDANDFGTTMRLDTVLDEEQAWADQANAQRSYFLISLLVAVLVCLAVLVWGIVSFMRYGKELKPTFTEEYWRDVPVAGEHPAVIGRLYRFDKADSNDFTATIMHLANEGALVIDRVTWGPNSTWPDDYRLTRVPAVELSLNSEIDRRTISLLFDTIAQGRPSLLLGEIRGYAEVNPQAFSDAMDEWQGLVLAHSIAGEYFESYSQSKQARMAAVAVLLIVGCVGLGILLDNLLMLIPGLVSGVALFVVSIFMGRRTQKGADAYARCMALKKWLTEFSLINERPPTDVKVWGEFMVYAYIFGVAEQAMRELRTAIPNMAEVYTTQTDAGVVVPWWVWYGPAVHGGASAMPDFGAALQSSVTESVQAVASALSESSSSGGGFGGGFSGGGGGGFGGGGGAR